MTDNLIANGLIYGEDAIEIRESFSTTKWTDQHTEWLLMKVLPKTDNLGYMKFCCLLRTKFRLLEIGERLCKECEKCLVERCLQSYKLKVFVGSSSCLPLLKHPMVQQRNGNFSIDFELVHNQTDLFISSIVCISKIFAWLELNIDKKYIDREKFQSNVAAGLTMPTPDVEISVFGVDGMNHTSMVVRLSPLAGLELLRVCAGERFRNAFGGIIADAMSSKLERTVSINLTVSDISPCLMKVVPTGTFHVQSDRNVGTVVTDGKTCLVYVLSIK